MPPENAYNRVQQLVKKFKALPSEARKHYNEDNTRKDFILPLFHALEWNIQDSHEVSAEERVSRGWVDFSFRIGGVPRFFLETKRISEVLATPKNILQAISYSWTKNVTWALLSDFEGLRVYNAEWKEDNPLQAQFLEFSVDTYLSDFERLWWLSRPEIAANTLNRQAEQWGKKTRREPVSQHLFDDLKTWRYELFRHLHAYNQIWSPAQIDEAVLRILNRLIFIRTAEDRLVEQSCLMPLLRELNDKKRIQDLPDRVKGLFREFDETYDSQLFEPGLADNLECEPSPYETVIEGLYGKQYLLYNFNAIDADVLGTAYEQYLGHVIADTQAAEIVEKQVKRKSQGIYYTPTFVVKYIVQQTVGRYLDENSYNPSHPPRVLDMACGSGSFLIEAFDVLDRHVAKLRRQDTPLLSLGEGSGVRGDLFDHARQMEILTQCIYGVDKDKQAVEVARLNLMLKVLHSREKLPLLENIRCGDSLISGTDEQIQAAFGENWKKINPFNWQEELPQVFKEGGFDVIIGNPPYVRQETLGDEFKEYAQRKFETYAGTADLYVYFIEQAHKLLKPGGYFGFIVSNKWMRSSYGKALRDFLTIKTTLLEIIDFGELPVFQDAATFPVIILTQNTPTKSQHFMYTQIKRLDFVSLQDEINEQTTWLDDRALIGTSWRLVNEQEQSIIEKLHKGSILFGEYIKGKAFYGIKTGYDQAFIIDGDTKNRLILEDANSAKLIKRYVIGDDVRYFHIFFRERYLIFIPKGWTRSQMGQASDAWGWFTKNYPAISRHLENFSVDASKRVDQGEYWWELRACGYYDEFLKPKIVFPEIAKESRFAFDDTGIFTNKTAFIVPTNDHYLLGLLNSKLSWLYLKRICSVLGDPDKGGRLLLQYAYVKNLPIHRIDFDNSSDKVQHDRISTLVQEMIQLQGELAKEIFESDHTRAIQRRIAAVDAEIDHLVYDLYGLTEEEIKIVEGSVS